MMLTKLIATLEIRKIAAAVRVKATTQRTPLTTPSITVEPLGRGRAFRGSLGRSLSCALRRVGHDVIGVVQRRPGFRDVAAAVHPGLALVLIHLERHRIERR